MVVKLVELKVLKQVDMKANRKAKVKGERLVAH